MKRMKGTAVLLAAAALLLSGCGGAEMVELSEEQTGQVVEYAANLLLKDAVNYSTRLVDTEAMLLELSEKRDRQAVLDAKVAAMKTAEDAAGGDGGKAPASSKKPGVVDASKGEHTAGSIGELLDAPSVTITYERYELVDTYPEGDEFYMFTMDATEGRKLLVVHFQMTNTAGETVAVDAASAGCRYQCNVNGEGYKSALSTLLLNDLGMYKGSLDAGKTQDVVLVWEVPEETAVSTMTLLAKRDSVQVKMTLL